MRSRVQLGASDRALQDRELLSKGKILKSNRSVSGADHADGAEENDQYRQHRQSSPDQASDSTDRSAIVFWRSTKGKSERIQEEM